MCNMMVWKVLLLIWLILALNEINLLIGADLDRETLAIAEKLMREYKANGENVATVVNELRKEAVER